MSQVPIANTFASYAYFCLTIVARQVQKEKPCVCVCFFFFLFFLQLRSRVLFCKVSSFRFRSQTEKPSWFLGRNATIWHWIFFKRTSGFHSRAALHSSSTQSFGAFPPKAMSWKPSCKFVPQASAWLRTQLAQHTFLILPTLFDCHQTNPHMLVCVFHLVYTREKWQRGCNIFLPRNKFSSRSEALAPSNLFTCVIIGSNCCTHTIRPTHTAVSAGSLSGLHLNIWGWAGDAFEGCRNRRASYCAAHWTGFSEVGYSCSSTVTVTANYNGIWSSWLQRPICVWEHEPLVFLGRFSFSVPLKLTLTFLYSNAVFSSKDVN